MPWRPTSFTSWQQSGGRSEPPRPPAGYPGEVNRKTPTDEGAYRSRVAQGYRAVRYSDYPEFPPYKNLISAAAVQPDETIMHKDDLILMMCSERYAFQRGRQYG